MRIIVLIIVINYSINYNYSINATHFTLRTLLQALVIGDTMLKYLCSTMRKGNTRTTDSSWKLNVSVSVRRAMIRRIGKFHVNSSTAAVVLCTGTNDIMRDYCRHNFVELYNRLTSVVVDRFPSAVCVLGVRNRERVWTGCTTQRACGD